MTDGVCGVRTVVPHRPDSVYDALQWSELRETKQQELIRLTSLNKKRSEFFLRRQRFSAHKGSCKLPETGEITSVLTLSVSPAGAPRVSRFNWCIFGLLCVGGRRTNVRRLGGRQSLRRFRSVWIRFPSVPRD